MYSSEGAIITPIVIALIMVYMIFFSYFFEDYHYQLQMHYYITSQSKGQLKINEEDMEKPKPIIGYGDHYKFEKKSIISNRVIKTEGEYMFSSQKFNDKPMVISKEAFWLCNDYVVWGTYDFWKNK